MLSNRQYQWRTGMKQPNLVAYAADATESARLSKQEINRCQRADLITLTAMVFYVKTTFWVGTKIRRVMTDSADSSRFIFIFLWSSFPLSFADVGYEPLFLSSPVS